MAHNIDQVTIALKKAKTSLEKVIKMVEQNKYCIDVIQQNLAVMGLVKSANMHLLDGHVNHCIKNACESGKKKEIEEKMGELLKVIKIAQTK